MVHYSHNSGWCRRSVAPWITVLSWHTYSQLGWITNLLWCDIPLNKASRTVPHHIWRIYALCPFSGHKKNTDDRAVGWMILLASVCYCDSQVGKHFFNSKSSVSNQNFTDGFLLEFDFFLAIAIDTYNSLPYSHSSVWLGTVAATQCR